MSLYEIEEHIGAMIAEAELPSEAVFNEQRACIEKWIQANSQKSKSPRTVSESNLKETQKKISHAKPPHSTEADVVHAKGCAEIVQSQASATKKPFLQHVLQRIFSK